MKIVQTLSHWPQSAHGSVMALGNFDGIHKGHQAVIGRAHEIARIQGRPLAVMTFEPHPRRFFKPSLPVLRIVPFAEKARLLRELGVDMLYVARFNQAFSELTPEKFIQDVLCDGLRVAHVVTGHNFAFGHRRGGNVTTLQQAATQAQFSYTQVEAVADGDVYSSTSIRNALSEGDMAAVSAVLGRFYSINGLVTHGDKRGRSIGFPTANMRPSPLYLPRFGVYAVLLHLQGQTYKAVANLGHRPTVDGTCCMLEVHALNARFDAYGKHARVEFVQFIRPEQKFSGLDALKTQIARDCEVAKMIHQDIQQKAQCI
jgi:riboflavin kinase/FMN adenylyltransferase